MRDKTAGLFAIVVAASPGWGCDSESPRPPAPTVVVAASSATASAPGPSASAPRISAPTATASVEAPIDPDCPQPWVMIRTITMGQRDVEDELRPRLASFPGWSPCTADLPRAPRDICVYRVRFWGSKSFERPEKNRDAIIARCASKSRCEALAVHTKAEGVLRCGGVIPTSGSIDKLAW